MPTQTRTLPLAQLDPDPGNERSASDAEAIRRLGESIRTHGLLQRLLVRPNKDGRYMVVAGHRRLQAAREAGLRCVPVEIRELDDDTARALQIIENLHREDVHPLDEAKGFDRLRGEERTLEDVAALVGHSAKYVAQRLSLVNLVPRARSALRDGKIRLGTAYALARIPNPKIQKQALQEVERGDEPMSVVRARNTIEQRFEMSLARAPFDPEGDELLKGAPSCRMCPKRAGNQPLLFEGPDLEARCTDPACFQKKVKAAGRQMARVLKRQGHTVHGITESREQFFEQGYRGWQLKERWIYPHERASYESPLPWEKILRAELRDEKVQTWVTHPDSGIVLRVFLRSRAMQVAKTAGHAWAGARKQKTAGEKRKDTERKARRLAEQRVTEALVARLDEVELDSHVLWLAEAILDSARSDSLRKGCQAFGLKREKDVQTNYGRQKESWRDRLVRALQEDEVSSRRLFVLVLTIEQGWTWRPSGADQPSLRERLIREMEIDEEAIGKEARASAGRS